MPPVRVSAAPTPSRHRARPWWCLVLSLALLSGVLSATGGTGRAVAATTVAGGTYQNTSSAVSYAGTWSTTSSGSDSGGSISTLAATGSATITFAETSVKWVARKGSSFGIATVYLDGTKVASVDLYAAANVFQSVVYSSPTLLYGTHTLRIERSGTKNDASSGRNIDLDSFVVPDTQAPAAPTGLRATSEGTGGRLAWTASTSGDVAGYRIYRATGTSSTYQSVNDTPLAGTTYLDPGLVPQTTYRYQVSAVDTSGNASPRTADSSLTAAGTAVPAGSYENTSSQVLLNGSWSTTSSASDSGGSISTLADTGFAQLSFNETSVKWVARKGSAFGIAAVYLDQTLVKTVDLYAASNTYQEVVYSSPTLSSGVHTLRIERTGDKNSASAGRTVDLDRFVVPDTRAPGAPTGLSAAASGSDARLTWNAGTESDLAGYRVYRATGSDSTYTLLTATPVTSPGYLDQALTPETTYRYQVTAVDQTGNESPRTSDSVLSSAAPATGAGTFENSSSQVQLVGGWTTVPSGSDSGGSLSTLGDAGFAQIAFRESSVKWVARKGSSFGIANVYLDGVKVSTVDLYAPGNLFRATVYSSPTLAYGVHTLRIERSGDKNSASSGRNVDLDSFLVPDSRPPATPAGLTTAPEDSGVRVTWTANPEPDVAGYRIYRASGTSPTYQLLTAEPLAATTYLDPALTPDTTQSYRITAVDSSGNESTPTADSAVTTAVSHGTFEGDDPAVAQTGTWTSTNDPAASEGTVETTTGPGSASLTFDETTVSWVGPTGPSGGIAQVLIDQVPVATVDQYSSSPAQGVTLYHTSGLKLGVHTITVQWTADENPAVTSANPTTSVDAFDVDDTVAPGAPQALWAQPTGSGVHVEWGEADDSDTSGYVVYRARGADGDFQRITDDTPLQDTELLDDNLDPGVRYRYKVTAVDLAGNESRASIVVQATTAVSTGTVENTGDPIVYSTPWTLTPSTRDSGGSSSALTVPGDASLTFSGTGIKWVTRTNNFSGFARVSIDGTAVADVDLYSSTQTYQKVVFSRTNLRDGTHVISISRLATKNAASTGRGISLDSLIVLDMTAPGPVAAPTLSLSRAGIKLSWPASSAADVDSYRLYRTSSDNPTEILLATVPVLQLTFLDIGLADDTSYSYRVTAVDTSGNESTSAASAQLRTSPAAAPVQQRYANCPTATRTVSTTGTLQNALNLAKPGEVIQLAPGRYTGYFTLSTSGTADQPIWICGPRTAVLDFGRNSGGFGVYLDHVSYVTLTGMTVRNVQKGVVVAGGSHDTVADVALDSIGEEALHLRSNTTDDTVIGNTISNTGLLTPGYGEGVYIGSDPVNWCNYSSCLPDASSRNSIIDNTISGTTAEAVEAKAGTVDGLVQGNTIDGARMTSPNSGGWVVIKGSNWLVRSNTGVNAPENGFTATLSKAPFWGRGNVFVGNSSTVNNPVGFGTWVEKGIGNLVACNESTSDGLRKINIVCQR